MKADENRMAEKILENIELPENLDQLVADSVEKGYERMKRKKELKRAGMIKKAAVIVGIAAAGTSLSFPVRALVTSLVQERMEQIPQEELTQELENMDAQQAEANRYSRAYTAGEQERLESLSRAYNQGTFPQKELRQEKTSNQKVGTELYFAQDTATFCLPDRELTDEEILQIINFNTKRDYALAQRKEQEEGTESGQKELELKKELAAAGGLTEEKAKELGKGWLLKLYGETGEGMELSFYLEEEYPRSQDPVYVIGYYLRSVRNSLVVLSAKDGSLIDTSETVAADELDAVVSTASAEEKAGALYQAAREALTNQLGMESDYEKVIMAYCDAEGHLGYLNQLTFLFVKSNGGVSEVTMSAVRDRMMGYREREDLEDYREEMERWLTGSAGANGSSGTMVYKEMQE